MRTFVFYPEYLEAINKLKREEDKCELMKVIIDYGCTGEYHIDNDELGVVDTIFNLQIKPGIDRAQNRYAETISNGQKGGRPLKYDWNLVAQLLKEGKSPTVVRRELGIPASTFSSWKRQHFDSSENEVEVLDEESGEEEKIVYDF